MSETKTKILSKSIGRRKSAIASVRLTSGSGNIVVNSKDYSSYFPGELAKTKLLSPFTTTKLNKYDASVKVSGGGISGQLEATVLGIARALVDLKNDLRSSLRNAGLLTRDSRERQRRMIGTGGKARRRSFLR
jgi:small subunit ribosomal protein S9